MSEAVVNAFMHREYRTHEVIQLEHKAGRLRVTSPRGFVLGVTIDNVTAGLGMISDELAVDWT